MNPNEIRDAANLVAQALEQGDVPPLGKPTELARLINTFATSTSGFYRDHSEKIALEYARQLFQAAASKTFELKPAEPTTYHLRPFEPAVASQTIREADRHVVRSLPITDGNAKAVLASLLTKLCDLELIRLPPDGDEPLVR